MRSLRLRLVLGTAACTVAVLLGSGAVLYVLISKTLWAEFDAALAGKARSLATLAEQERDGLEFELAETSLPEFEASDHAEYYQVWLSDGRVFARSPSLQDQNLLRISDATEMPAFRTVNLPAGRPGRIVGITFVPRQENDDGASQTPIEVTLVVGRETAGLAATLAQVRGLLIAVCLAAVALSAALLGWLVSRGLRPINQLSTQIASVNESDLSVRFDPARIPTELLPVVTRLNDLLARLEAAFQRERRFTGDVAHELRTPLAGVRSILEVALSRERDPAAYREALDNCLSVNLQMQNLVENLLNLARADAGQLELRHENVDIPELMRECWALSEPAAQARRLTVDWALNSVKSTETDRDKLRLVLRNLFDNVVTHANDAGRVGITARADDEAIVLLVSNTGSTLTAADVRNVFDRFWRADTSRSASDGHCGLGLPLCKALIEQLDGSIAATTAADGTFTITIRLPRERGPAPYAVPKQRGEAR